MTIACPVDCQVYYPCQDLRGDPKFIEIARTVLDRITEIDVEARTAREAQRENGGGFRAYIEIAANKIRLHYVSKTTGAEWDGIFKPTERWQMGI